MSKSAWKLIAALFTAALVGCGGGGGSGSAAPGTFGSTVFRSIVSAQTGSPYNFDIWLPPGYATSAATHPVVYATDCEYRFDVLQSVLLARSRRGATQAILVNICAGPTSQRFTDYTMPGAARYFGFLTLELIPYVDANFRTNPSKRILSGHSLSGELAMYAFYLQNPAQRFFTSIVSEEGSFWYDAAGLYQGDSYAPAVAMETAMFNANRSLPIDLVMAGDTTGNGPHVSFLYNTIAGQQFQNLHLLHTSYTLGHVPMDGPAFSDALTFIFGD
jgi:predicted alpha/beta superfamily hydrolase